MLKVSEKFVKYNEETEKFAVVFKEGRAENNYFSVKNFLDMTNAYSEVLWNDILPHNQPPETGGEDVDLLLSYINILNGDIIFKDGPGLGYFNENESKKSLSEIKSEIFELLKIASDGEKNILKYDNDLINNPDKYVPVEIKNIATGDESTLYLEYKNGYCNLVADKEYPMTNLLSVHAKADMAIINVLEKTDFNKIKKFYEVNERIKIKNIIETKINDYLEKNNTSYILLEDYNNDDLTGVFGDIFKSCYQNESVKVNVKDVSDGVYSVDLVVNNKEASFKFKSGYNSKDLFNGLILDVCTYLYLKYNISIDKLKDIDDKYEDFKDIVNKNIGENKKELVKNLSYDERG